ncbi:hypothetical protein EDB83DRAFT_2526040 [Lactarius deliciosus]|nr:hypothetical protein EDB83DRAFT_2526040 [Lactarius deliciosus]
MSSHRPTINILNDDVLLEVFDLVRSSSAAYEDRFYPVWEWYPLVHVCSRWREIIFASPLRLDLQLHCTHGTPVKKGLGYWPPTLPIAIDYGYYSGPNLSPDDEDNMFAALEQRERVRLLRLSITTAVLEKVVTLMQVSFPELRHLTISSEGLNIPILTDGFLGGSAPSLREISLTDIPFPAFPTLLSSASGLVELVLVDIHETTDFPPAACAACLADLPRLERLSIDFRFLRFRTHQTHLPPETRAVLPSLTYLRFEGDSTYLEVIMARIDTPQLYSINISYSDPLIYGDQPDPRVTDFSKFIERSAIKPSRFGHAEISFEDDGLSFYFFRKADPDEPTIAIKLLSNDVLSQLIYLMAQVLNQTSAMVSDVVRLEIAFDGPVSDWRDDIDAGEIEWLDLFRPFTAVKRLRIYRQLAESITQALEDQTKEAEAQVLQALKLVEDQRGWHMEDLIDDLRERGKLPSNSNEELDSDDTE